VYIKKSFDGIFDENSKLGRLIVAFAIFFRVYTFEI